MTDYKELVERLRAEQFTLEELSIILPKAAAAIEELLPKRGEWKTRDDVYPYKPDGEITSWTYRCSVCGKLSNLKYNYCHNCGADMEVQDDD